MKYECGKCTRTFNSTESLTRHKSICLKPNKPVDKSSSAVPGTETQKRLTVKNNEPHRRSARPKVKLDYWKQANPRYSVRSAYLERKARLKEYKLQKQLERSSRNGAESKKKLFKGKKEYSCDNCTYTSWKKRHLKHHLRTCCKLYDFRCPSCEFGSREFSKVMLDHLRFHHSDVPNYCIASFETSTNRFYPPRHHRGSQGAIKCELCPSSFKSPSRLKLHLKTECRKIVMCLLCRKIFTTDKRVIEHHLARFHNKGSP